MSNSALSTAGAVPVFNEKGERSMQKVKVQRYVSGRRPNYAVEGSSSGEESDEEFGKERLRKKDDALSAIIVNSEPLPVLSEEAEKSDRRLQRLRRREEEQDDQDQGRDRERRVKSRQIREPEILTVGEKLGLEIEPRRPRREAAAESSEEEVEDENVEKRHALLRQKREVEEEELLGHEEEGESEEEEEESEYEEYTDSEDETGPRLKPVFVRKKERVTVQEKEKQEEKEREAETEQKRIHEERRKQTLKIMEEEQRKEEKEREEEEDEMLRASIAAINTDDENEEAGYETWKLRELKRVKRDKDERDLTIREKLEIERIRNMTEEERQEEFRNNPKEVTNKATKGKYRFLQKYYHRGVFFLDEDDTVFKRDFAQPTLEDHFDKTVLPKVMQVKNFGRSGRTKYTHLVDQDTTAFDSPWASENAQSSKFQGSQAGGLKQVFERPTKKRK